MFHEQMNNICDEHGVVLSCDPHGLICPLYTNTRIEGCNSMTKQTASCTNYIYRRDQRRFTIIEDQNNHLVSMSIHLHVH